MQGFHEVDLTPLKHGMSHTMTSVQLAYQPWLHETEASDYNCRSDPNILSALILKKNIKSPVLRHFPSKSCPWN